MCHKLLNDTRLYRLLHKIDEDAAAQVKASRCLTCGAALHAANYPRKPRGGPPGFDCRLSFCCAAEGCRRRTTPPSVLFLGRRTYFAVVIVIVTTMLHGATPQRVRKVAAQLEVSHETIRRWRSWWREVFPTTSFWRIARGRFAPSVDESELPRSLMKRFGDRWDERIDKVLRFLSPLTTTSASVSERSFAMGC